MPDRPEDDLQFDQAEYGDEAKAAAQTCSACAGSLGAQYFLANNQVVCASCVEQINAQRSTGSPYGRFGLATVLGLIAIVVGFAAGAAVNWGSSGRGGKPYQLLAVFTTYASPSRVWSKKKGGELASAAPRACSISRV